jgi:hypothetical protein
LVQFCYRKVFEHGCGMERILETKDLAGGDDGTRTRDLMRDRHAF